ncbi:MAG: type IX secretion system outer membrane channel protein PorV [Bacteroidales bacterium]|nr:type IX secretion system outer membrane channel protein PorV [Bacteroidales bacterium]
MKKLTFLTLLIALGGSLMAQTSWLGQSSNQNYISTGMPILLIAPDAISSGMGDVGAATTPDAYSSHWNNAKYAFIEGSMGISTTFTPWLRNLKVGDMNLLYLGGYYRINPRSTVAASLTYFSLGDIDMTDVEGLKIMDLHPNEYAFDATYALMLTDNLSLGATGRFVRSDLTNGQTINDGSGNSETHAANSLSADIGLYYQRPVSKNEEIALGAFISNLGAKLRYSEDNNNQEFLPANLRVGGRYTNRIDDFNKISVMVDINKLLVPTPKFRTFSQDSIQSLSDYNNIGVIAGALQSFGDAPGGINEELQELQLSLGTEYWYAETFAVRAGYFFEHANKGGRQYATVGFGLRYTIFAFDFSYLVPTARLSTNPLAHTIRISLSVDLTPSEK